MQANGLILRGSLIVREARLGHLVVESGAGAVVYFEYNALYNAKVEPPNKSPLGTVLPRNASIRGLYTPPPFPAGLRSDSVGLDLSRMPNFWLWNGWNCPVTFR